MSLRCIGLLIRSHESQLSRVVLMMWWCGFNFSQDVDQCQFKIEWSWMGVIWLLKVFCFNFAHVQMPQLNSKNHLSPPPCCRRGHAAITQHVLATFDSCSSQGIEQPVLESKILAFWIEICQAKPLGWAAVGKEGKNKERWETDMENRWK